MPQDHPSTHASLNERLLRHADEAIVREELLMTRQHRIIAAAHRAGVSNHGSRKLLGNIESYLVRLNAWRQRLLNIAES